MAMSHDEPTGKDSSCSNTVHNPFRSHNGQSSTQGPGWQIRSVISTCLKIKLVRQTAYYMERTAEKAMELTLGLWSCCQEECSIWCELQGPSWNSSQICPHSAASDGAVPGQDSGVHECLEIIRVDCKRRSWIYQFRLVLKRVANLMRGYSESIHPNRHPFE
jgi:hypothetical protein